MIAIRSYVPSLLTFPGVVLRQVVHLGFCRVAGVKVLDVRFFRYDTPSGYVLHEMPKSFQTSLVLALGPLFVHSLICLGLCSIALVPWRYYDEVAGIHSVFLMWMGLSIGVHAFPPRRDSSNMWTLTRKEIRQHGALVRVIFPIIVFLRLAERLTLYGFDVAYAGVVGVAIPWVLLSHLIPQLPGT